MANSTLDVDTLYDDPLDEEDSAEDALETFKNQILVDRSWALNYYSARNEEFVRMEKWYFKDHYNSQAEVSSDGVMDEETDDSEHLTIIPIPTNIVNSVHGILTDEAFVIECISSANRTSEQKSSNTERLLYGAYWINCQINGGDPWEEASLDALVYGWGCVYSMWDPERAKLARKKGTGRSKDVLDFYAWPIIVRRINPRDIYPLPFGTREKWRGQMWIVERSVREVEEEWNCPIEPKCEYGEDGLPLTDDAGATIYQELNDETLIEYTDYWVWKRDNGELGNKHNDDWTLWHAVMANDCFMKEPTPMPEYEMLPYEIFFCRRSPSDSGSKMGLSFMYPIIEPVQEMEYLANRQSRMIEMYADPVLVVTDPTGDPADIEKEPGTIITVGPGGDAHYVTWNGSPPDVGALRNMWQQIAQDAFPPVMTGGIGGTSGLDTIALQQGGKLQTNKPRRNLEMAIARVNTKIIRLVQQFSMNEAIYVMGQRTEGDAPESFAFSIKGKETRGFENTVVTIRGRFPQEELRNVAVAAQAVGAGLNSARTAMGKYMYVQDPEKEFKLWSQEQLIKDPILRQFYMQQYMNLPAQSPVSQALQGSPAPDDGGMGDLGDMSQALAGGIAGSATAETDSQVQSAVQTTPVTSNIFSAITGGAPTPPGNL